MGAPACGCSDSRTPSPPTSACGASTVRSPPNQLRRHTEGLLDARHQDPRPGGHSSKGTSSDSAASGHTHRRCISRSRSPGRQSAGVGRGSFAAGRPCPPQGRGHRRVSGSASPILSGVITELADPRAARLRAAERYDINTRRARTIEFSGCCDARLAGDPEPALDQHWVPDALVVIGRGRRCRVTSRSGMTLRRLCERGDHRAHAVADRGRRAGPLLPGDARVGALAEAPEFRAPTAEVLFSPLEAVGSRSTRCCTRAGWGTARRSTRSASGSLTSSTPTPSSYRVQLMARALLAGVDRVLAREYEATAAGRRAPPDALRADRARLGAPARRSLSAGSPR